MMMRFAVRLGLVALSAAVPRAGASAQAVDVARLGYDRGHPDAPISIIEFGDFGCSACAKFARETYGQLNREYIATGLVKWKYIPFILGSFPNSDDATRTAECAAAQDSFWSMHDLLYARQRDWVRRGNPREQLEELAMQLRLDMPRFRRCYRENEPKDRIDRNNRAAAELMVRATPTFFINGQRAVGALPIEEWRKLLAVIAGRQP